MCAINCSGGCHECAPDLHVGCDGDCTNGPLGEERRREREREENEDIAYAQYMNVEEHFIYGG